MHYEQTHKVSLIIIMLFNNNQSQSIPPSSTMHYKHTYEAL